MESFAGRQRFEDAATSRRRLAMLLRATIRMQRLTALTGLAEMVAARPAAAGGWEFAVIRYGRLAGAGTSPPRVHPKETIEALVATAETVRPAAPGPTPAASAAESERVLAWIEQPDARLVSVSDGWRLPVPGAAQFTPLLHKVEKSGEARPDFSRSSGRTDA
jgi:DNA polymerase-3 subunit epsilon